VSAFLCSKAHLDLLIAAGFPGRGSRNEPVSWLDDDGILISNYGGGMAHRVWLTPENANDVLRMLARANLANTFDPMGEADFWPEDWPTRNPDGLVWNDPGIPIVPVEILKAIKCYEYQCDFPAFRRSSAASYCSALRDHMILFLPGWEEAPWGWWADEVVSRSSRPPI
jgi:hypothetical protein